MERHVRLMRYLKQKREAIERGQEWPEHPAAVKVKDVQRIRENIETLTQWIMDEIKDLSELDPKWAHFQEQVTALKEEELANFTGKVASILAMVEKVFGEEAKDIAI